MPNPYFQFKQFKVEQDRCGMKVSTDACIFGAYFSYPATRHILDIGTGTGLLSLMLAQTHPTAQIDAVELEPNACEQAWNNFQNSPWGGRINLYKQPVQEFNPSKLYDLIICNPPFYPKHLQSKDPQRRLAFHQNSLSFPELANSFRRLLSENGIAAVLLPPRQAEEFSKEAQKFGLYCLKELLIADRPSMSPHRSIRIFKFSQQKELLQENISIRTEEGDYSHAFRKLLQDYYLIF